MSNTPVAVTADRSHLKLASPAVEPFITAAVGDVARPRGVLQPSRDLRHLPGEEGLIVGLGNIAGWMRHGVAYLVEKERRFGKVHRTQFGAVPFVHVGDPELLARITRNEDRAFSAALGWQAMFEGVDAARETVDYTVTMDFDLHRDARKLLQPAFGAAATASYLDVAMPLFEQAIGTWLRDGQVDFKKDIRSLLARVSIRTFLGVEDEREVAMIERATADVWGTFLALAKRRWSPSQRRAIRGHARLVEVLRPRVAERRARGGEDLFSRLCAETRGAQWLDDDGVVRLFIGILLAAFDTTACALASMAYLLAKNPDWQDRLRAEAEGVGPSRISYEETKRLVATECAWNETLRLMPVTGGLPRYTLRDVRLGNWQIPAGAFVNTWVGTVLRSSEWWTDPERFDPDRFSAARAEDRKHRGLFLPFGSGAHVCIGMHLATAEAKAFWHAMLTRCQFRLAHDHEARHTYTPLGMVSGDVKLVVEPIG